MRFAEVVSRWPLSNQQPAVHHLQPISDVDRLGARPDASDALITLTANRLSPPGAINHHTRYSVDTKRTSGILRLCCSSACLFVVSCVVCTRLLPLLRLARAGLTVVTAERPAHCPDVSLV